MNSDQKAGGSGSSFLDRWLGWFVTSLVILLAIVLPLDWHQKDLVLWVFAVSLLIFGIYVFTSGGNEMPQARVMWMFRLAYAYTLVALIGSTLPFMLPEWSVVPEGDARSQIRILRACACPARSDGTDDVPQVVQCDALGSASWVLNIGGAVYPEGPCPDRDRGGSEVTPVAGSGPARSAEPAGAGDGPTAGGTAAETESPATGSPDEGPKGWQVRGGLAVPFFVIVLALVGGAVSMTRRVPEYQKRVCQWYEECREIAGNVHSDHPCSNSQMRCGSSRGYAQGPLSPSCVRDCLVFQMMQVAAAPFIAVVAYYALSPRSVTTTVLLAFLSGFTSETILYLLRAAANRLTPAPEGKAPGEGDEDGGAMGPDRNRGDRGSDGERLGDANDQSSGRAAGGNEPAGETASEGSATGAGVSGAEPSGEGGPARGPQGRG